MYASCNRFLYWLWNILMLTSIKHSLLHNYFKFWFQFVKVPMKWNLFLFSFKIYLVEYAIPKLETSGVKSNDFTSLQSWAFCLPKMVRGMGWVNPKIPSKTFQIVRKLTDIWFYIHNFISYWLAYRNFSCLVCKTILA